MDRAILCDQLLRLLEGGNAHITFRRAIANLSLDQINSRVPDIPYSVWGLVEHMRIAQFDILDFIRNPDYMQPKWPDEYWPAEGQEATEETWNKTIKAFEDDMEALKEIVKNPQTDFTAPLPHAPKYTVLREILLVADHNSYHIGQIVSLRRALKNY